ncbi:MAG: FtsL-like putative cell division protein [Bacteroidota bacterium]
MAVRRTLRDYTSIGSMSAELVLKNLPFIFFLGFLATIYIANAHYAERTMRNILSLQKEVRDLQREYNSLQAEIMFNSRYSEVEKSVAELGLKRIGRQPKKIIVRDLEIE